MSKIIFQDKTTVAEIREKIHSVEYCCMSVLGFDILELFLSETCAVPDASQVQREGKDIILQRQMRSWKRYKQRRDLDQKSPELFY